jgi:hypothetical protein
MQKTTRRHLLQAAAVGGVTAVGLSTVLGAGGEGPGHAGEHDHQDNGDHDRRSNHTVSFGNWSPSTGNPLRVEAVAFNEQGRYLVMCGVLPHFFDAASGDFVMFGYVEVNDRVLTNCVAASAALRPQFDQRTESCNSCQSCCTCSRSVSSPPIETRAIHRPSSTAGVKYASPD